jgi:DtxR family Mn-dependent transcriptional regulator
VTDTPLASIDAPAELEISRVNSHDPDVLQYLASLNLIPSQPITLLGRAPFNGPLRLKIGVQEQVIGHELAAGIRVVTI